MHWAARVCNTLVAIIVYSYTAGFRNGFLVLRDAIMLGLSSSIKVVCPSEFVVRMTVFWCFTSLQTCICITCFSVSPRWRAHVLVHHFKGKRYENGHACHAQYWIYSSVVDLYDVVDLEISSWVTLPSLCCCQGSVNVEKYGKGVVSTLHSGDDFGKLAIVNDVAR